TAMAAAASPRSTERRDTSGRGVTAWFRCVSKVWLMIALPVRRSTTTRVPGAEHPGARLLSSLTGRAGGLKIDIPSRAGMARSRELSARWFEPVDLLPHHTRCSQADVRRRIRGNPEVDSRGGGPFDDARGGLRRDDARQAESGGDVQLAKLR